MFRTVKLGRSLFGRLQKRTFLAESYICEEHWDKRRQSETLRTVKPSILANAIDQEHRKTNLISAVDVDLFANAITEDQHAETLIIFLRHLRLTSQALKILDSTHQAVFMYLLSHGLLEELLVILHDRLTYGIFPNWYNYNILMDVFVLRNEFTNAAKVAVLPMLQDDPGNAITQTLALYACHKHLENPAEWVPQEEEDDGEEVKVRVPYLRNPYYDDHFDIKEPELLVGKTMAFFGKQLNDAIGRSCQLRGLVLYKKYQKASDLLADWKRTINKDMIYLDAKNLILEHLKEIPEDQRNEDVKRLEPELQSLDDGSLASSSLIAELEESVKKAVEECSATDIEAQQQLFERWEEQRKAELATQTAEINRQKRIKQIEQLKKELEDKEELLTFFRKEEQIELTIERNEEEYRKQYEERIASNPKRLKQMKKLELLEQNQE